MEMVKHYIPNHHCTCRGKLNLSQRKTWQECSWKYQRVSSEYSIGMEVSTSGDIYSYEILLFEMLIGKRLTDDMFKDGLNLHKLVR
ncbi:putative non-specific serine/threonine protein kinase [Rosa chinensis]|uniref:Putative non-specific serine/threonine protein kinase n=1 Tax=Rosa chinensis TaxID=74649 RepID=A0A2P6P7L3_ROSCH|nr:putative non-specific serine/threonine protein kinase [Rosa chinensis]